MTEQTKTQIKICISADNTITNDEQKHIDRALGRNNGRTRKALISTKEAASLLECSVMTLYRYEKKGSVSAIRYSARKIRWDKDEVTSFRDNGFLPPSVRAIAA